LPVNWISFAIYAFEDSNPYSETALMNKYIDLPVDWIPFAIYAY
jgi:hypothetical protein